MAIMYRIATNDDIPAIAHLRSLGWETDILAEYQYSIVSLQ